MAEQSRFESAIPMEILPSESAHDRIEIQVETRVPGTLTPTEIEPQSPRMPCEHWGGDCEDSDSGSGSKSKRSKPWDIFLSHKQANAQDAVINMKTSILAIRPHCTFWLDVEQDATEKGMHEGVKESRNFLLYLTEGVTESGWVQMEIAWALKYGKRIILVQETDERHGRPEIDKLMAALPVESKKIFTSNVAIPWYRDPAFQKVSVEKIIAASTLSNEKRGPQNLKAQKLAYGKINPNIECMPEKDGNASEKTLQQELGEAQEVFDKNFAKLCTCAGLPLPGAGQRAWRWAALVRGVTIVILPLWWMRFFMPAGPSSLDIREKIDMSISVSLILKAGFDLHKTLRSDLLVEIMQVVDCRHLGQALHLATRYLVYVCVTLFVIGISGLLVSYLPGWFHPQVVQKSGINSEFVFAMLLGTTSILIFPFALLHFICAVMLIFALQMLAAMDLVTAFNNLNPQIGKVGIRECIMQELLLDVTDANIVSFQTSYLRAWNRYQKLQISVGFVVVLAQWFIILSYTLHMYCAVMLMMDSEYAEAKVALLQANPYLLGQHLFWNTFGFKEIILILAFAVHLIHSTLTSWVSQLILSRASLRSDLLIFIAGLDVHFPFLSTRTRAHPSLLKYVLFLVLMTSLSGFWEVVILKTMQN
eukprot:gnl/MRDRNA2_/MRDRNA2_64333_c0_seq1.p1 gnl/MRDRNA2_/MRDRNA2_64333_c0~~gnl/MRDRNA2_/MRDRNA2_64333_c0_seq1.p1  ORF type:complete len:669 (-),score=87.11 gnl/MRDRNA2_/MRDRNA2_64333_c0_seq1:327-2270(-)